MSTVSEDTTERKERRREAARDRFLDQLARVNRRLAEETSLQLLISSFEHLQSKKVIYENAHDDIELQLTKEQARTINAELSEDQEAFEDVEAKVSLRTRIAADQQEPGAQQQGQVTQFPQSPNYRSLFSFTPESLPKFEGDPLEFAAFWDRMKAEVHDNPELSNARKFGILSSCLRGPPAEMIKGLSQTDANYPVIVDLLFSRYHDVRRVVEAHVQKIMDLEVSGQNLRSFLDKCEAHVRALNAIGKSVTVDTMDGVLSPGEILVTVLKRKLPEVLRRKWEAQQIRESEPSFSKFLEFLKDQVKLEESLDSSDGHKDEMRHDQRMSSKRGKVTVESPKRTSAFAGSTITWCPFCTEEGHERISQCKVIETLPQHIRFSTAQRARICYMCLVERHPRGECPAKLPGCGVKECQYKHHRLLHQDRRQKPTAEKSGETAESVKGNATSRFRSSGLLQTFKAEIAASDYERLPVSVLLDPGSDSSFIDADLERKLNLGGKQVRISLDTVGSEQKSIKSKRVKFRLVSQRNPSEGRTLEALTLSQVASISRIPIIDGDAYSHLRNLNFAPQPDVETKTVDVLIGADFYYDFVTGRMKKGKRGEPVAIETIFGWIVGGPHKTSAEDGTLKVRRCNVRYPDEVSDEKLDLERFWEFETGGITSQKSRSRDQTEQQTEEAVYQRFKETIEFVKEHYQVRLPWKEDCTEMPNNFPVAYECLKRSERKHKHNEKAMKAYEDAIQEYVDMGFAEIVAEPLEDAAVEKPGKRVWYLPHHAVVKEDRETTKVRIVFNGASKHEGISLNDHLHTGPNLLPSIVGIILRFRLKPVAFTADIKKMFLQIYVHPDDRDALRYLWRDKQGKLQVLRFLKVIFGTNCSPFLAIGSVRHHCDQKSETYPEATAVVKRDMYMDDLASGSDTTEKAKRIVKDCSRMMKEGGFELTKWTSNKEEVLSILNPDEKSAIMKKAPEEREQKILGVVWNISEDRLRVQSAACKTTPDKFTKRSLLKDVASIFDPLGILSPFTVTGRVLLQDCWKAKVEWDSPLPEEIETKYRTWRQELPYVEKVSTHRFIFAEGDPKEGHIELHGFGDASERAYGAAVFLKYQTTTGPVVQLLVSKSRVAPIKGITLPKLELTAAVLTAQLLDFVKQEMGLSVDSDKIHAWSDSEIALHWITGRTSQDIFVKNRISKILGMVPIDAWRHCPGKDNPADCLSRGVTLKKMVDSRWIAGPEWLEEVDMGRIPPFKTDQDQEISANASNQQEVVASEPLFDLLRFPFHIALRQTAHVMRFVNNVRNPGNRKGEVTCSELRIAEAFWIKHYQKEHYKREVDALKAGKPIPKDSTIKKLDPILDDSGLLRVGGRIDEAKESYRSRHPVIVPKNSAVAKRIVERAHKIALHAYTDQVLTLLRQSYWIPSARNLIKQVRGECPTCRRFGTRPASQKMGPLPAERLTLTTPFESCGIDFAGPINVKSEEPGSNKVYICLFVCMTTRAVHLELTTDLSVDKFLQALRRMNSRRGPTKLILSDNAKTFKAADKILQQATKKLTEMGITWKFIPERGPWQGGQYERLVRTVKTPLRKILGSSLLSIEELQTVLCEVECQVNSRPLLPASDDVDDFQVLTPAHFLVGRKVADADLFDSSKVGQRKTTLRQRWKHIQQVTTNLKNRWRKEYLITLQERGKWLQTNRNLKTGDVVLVEDESSPRAMWPIARVQETTTGRDGLIRSAVVKKIDGKAIRRPIQKLYLLEANDTE